MDDKKNISHLDILTLKKPLGIPYRLPILLFILPPSQLRDMSHLWQVRLSGTQVRRLAAQGRLVGVPAVPELQGVPGPHLLVGGRANVLQPAQVRLPNEGQERGLHTHPG